MLEYVMLIISFIGLYISIIWINLLFLSKKEIEESIKPKKGYYPSITFTIPAYNEETTIAKTIESILNIDYPKDRYEIFVIDDGSKDNTAKIAKKYKKEGVIVISTKNHGKGHALNVALKRSKKELFACVDADSYIEKESVIRLVQHFRKKEISGCSSSILIRNHKKIIEKIQVFEYMYAAIFRTLYSFINCMYVTPGVLSVYRTEDLKTEGYFDEADNITEDLEIALRLHNKHKHIAFEIRSITHTNAPDTFKALMRQRIRWFRGYIYNARKYKHMHLNKEFGLLGLFMLPLNILGIFIVFLTTTIVFNGIFTWLKYIYQRTIIAETSILNLIDILTIKQTLLTINFKITIPLLIITAIGLYMMYKAHKLIENKIDLSPKSIIAFLLFLTVYSWIVTLSWICSLILELRKSKRVW
ncbi:MAG: glycosyltransferase family 2 protein [DPANN group archaeon]|nr:glycosyltransferase family 2 protein [DPANN group archaeon]